MASKKSKAQRGATRLAEPKKKRELRLHRPAWLNLALIGWLMVPVLAFGMLWGGRQLVDRWVITDVIIAGEPVIWSRDDIKAQAHWVIGEGFYSADLNRVYDAIDAMPLIHGVKVRKRWPGLVEIAIEEDIPMALWNGDQIIGINGDLMAIPSHLDVDNLALIEGDIKYLEDAIKHFRFIQQAIAMAGIRIQTLHVSDTGSLSLDLSNDWTVTLGRQQLERRALRLKKLLTGLPAEAVSTVDLRYGKGAAIDWRAEQEKG